MSENRNQSFRISILPQVTALSGSGCEFIHAEQKPTDLVLLPMLHEDQSWVKDLKLFGSWI